MNETVFPPVLRRWPDRLGAFFSILCGLHCAAFSLMIVLYPTIMLNRELWQSGVLEHVKHMEDWLFVFAWIFATMAMTIAWLNRKAVGPPILAAIGLVLLTVALKTPLHEYALAGSLVALTGGIVLASAHIWNLRQNRRYQRLPANQQVVS